MFSRTTVRRWALVAGAGLAGVLAAATLAFADGEDDPDFGVGGTAYPFLLTFNGASAPYGTPLTAVAPDGRIVLAGGVFATRTTRGGAQLPATGFLVMRMTSTGQPDGTFGPGGVRGVETPAGRPLILDLDVAADRTVIGAGTVDGEQTTQTGTDDRAVADAPEDVRVFRLAPDGTFESQQVFEAPAGCNEARAAQIAADGSVFALWGACDGADQLARRGLGGGDWTADVPGELVGVDLALGPNGDLHVLTADQTFGSRDVHPAANTVVLRYAPDGTLNPAYGGRENTLEGAPIDFDVDGSGRTVAWVRQQNQRRDASGNWEFRRLGADGTPDLGWGGGGYAALGGPEFGPTTLPFDDCVFPEVDGCRVFQLRAQPDGKVIATGPPVLPPVPDRDAGEYGHAWTVARMRADGERDPSWGTNGVRVLTFAPATGDDPHFTYLGQPALQPDGRVLLPFVALRRPAGRVQPPSGPGAAYGVQRLGSTPQQTTTQGGQQTTAQQQQAAPPAPRPVQAAAPSAAPARVCKSRRRFTIRLRTGRRKAERSPIVSASVRVNGKRVTVSRRARRTARVILVNLPRGRFSVSIRLRLADGGIVRETRRYRTCAKKIERQLGPLRTHPPRR